MVYNNSVLKTRHTIINQHPFKYVNTAGIAVTVSIETPRKTTNHSLKHSKFNEQCTFKMFSVVSKRL